MQTRESAKRIALTASAILFTALGEGQSVRARTTPRAAGQKVVTYFQYFAFDANGWVQNELPLFNSMLGILDRYTINVAALGTMTKLYENTSPSPVTFDVHFSNDIVFELVNPSVSFCCVTFVPGTPGAFSTTYPPVQLTLPAFDGTLDFAGSSAGQVGKGVYLLGSAGFSPNPSAIGIGTWPGYIDTYRLTMGETLPITSSWYVFPHYYFGLATVSYYYH